MRSDGIKLMSLVRLCLCVFLLSGGDIGCNVCETAFVFDG